MIFKMAEILLITPLALVIIFMGSRIKAPEDENIEEK